MYPPFTDEKIKPITQRPALEPSLEFFSDYINSNLHFTNDQTWKWFIKSIEDNLHTSCLGNLYTIEGRIEGLRIRFKDYLPHHEEDFHLLYSPIITSSKRLRNELKRGKNSNFSQKILFFSVQKLNFW